MGYSCTAAAALVLDQIRDMQVQSATLQGVEKPTSNGFYQNGKCVAFWESGREQNDGAITGSIWKMMPDGWCRRNGTFRIEADGVVTRFPHVSKAMRDMAQTIGIGNCVQRYGRV